jgi:hypothetical protein
VPNDNIPDWVTTGNQYVVITYIGFLYHGDVIPAVPNGSYNKPSRTQQASHTCLLRGRTASHHHAAATPQYLHELLLVRLQAYLRTDGHVYTRQTILCLQSACQVLVCNVRYVLDHVDRLDRKQSRIAHTLRVFWSTIQLDNVPRTKTLLKCDTSWDSIFEKRTLISI